MMGYRIRPAADADLDDQAAYLAREVGIDLALRFHDSAARTFDSIAKNPGIGERRESSNLRLAGLRVWCIEGFANHLVFYRLEGDEVEIVRVLHGVRDLGGAIDPD
jgi:toxin ParE1/3/4